MCLLSVDYVEFRLRSRWHSELFLALLALVALAGGAEAIKIAAVVAFGRSTNVSEVRRGLALDPDNAQLHHRLSQLYGDSLALSNLTERVAQARRATALNPNKSEYWLNLASACESIRDDACGDQSLQRALVLSPMAPLVWWVAGDHYLRTNQPEAALSCFSRLLELSPDYVPPVLALTFRVYGDPKVIFEKVVGGGSDARLALAYADFMSANNEFDAAHQAWSRVGSRGSAFTFAAIRPYLEQLLSHGRFQEAHAVWVELERRGTIAKPPDGGQGNLVFNGGFEQPPLGAGFDWRSQPSPYASLDFADPSAYEGARCLRVDFPVSQNVELEPVCQIIPVAPGRVYTLAAYLRTKDITSECGPRLRVVDPYCSDCLSVSTESTSGTTAWHSVKVSFTTGNQTQLVRVSVWRPRCRTFPMDISGSFWLDAVSLRAVVDTQ
jgi:tetratricopeptide (TPR) repeat protein